jgi:D-glycero-alpha-D-manno-heptose-7-phosphate kinase
VFVEQILCSAPTRHELERNLVLLYTGQTRRAESILEEQSRNSADRDATRAGLRRMVGLAGQLRDALNRSDLDGFGDVLHANWEQKRHLACGITNPKLDGWYDTARAHGAIGGKVLGAGGGGFMLLYAPADRHADICAALPTLRRVTFHFEPQGSRLIYVEENGYPG